MIANDPVQGRSDFREWQDKLNTAGGDGRTRHGAKLSFVRVLRESPASGLLDCPNAVGTVASASR